MFVRGDTRHAYPWGRSSLITVRYFLLVVGLCRLQKIGLVFSSYGRDFGLVFFAYGRKLVFFFTVPPGRTCFFTYGSPIVSEQNKP